MSDLISADSFQIYSSNLMLFPELQKILAAYWCHLENIQNLKFNMYKQNQSSSDNLLQACPSSYIVTLYQYI